MADASSSGPQAISGLGEDIGRFVAWKSSPGGLVKTARGPRGELVTALRPRSPVNEVARLFRTGRIVEGRLRSSRLISACLSIGLIARRSIRYYSVQGRSGGGERSGDG